jgi:hypothetical protein
MVVVPDILFDAGHTRPRSQQGRVAGPRHIADVLGELFERFPVSLPETEAEEIVEPAAA